MRKYIKLCLFCMHCQAEEGFEHSEDTYEDPFLCVVFLKE
jgi:hypothetical protein